MIEINIKVEKGKFPPLTAGQISKLTRSVAARVRSAVQKSTPVGESLSAGQSKRTRDSWTPVKKDEGGYSFQNPLVQAYSLEYGSKRGKRPWPSVPETNPRTVYTRGRVYSSQAPEGITTKANVDELANKISSKLFNLIIQGKSIAKG